MARMPGTRHELLRARYEFKSAAKCKRANCSAPIEWWRTTNGKMMPFDPMPEDHSLAVSHWGTCPNAEDFRSSAPTPQPAPTPAGTLARMQHDATALRDRTDARAVVLVSEAGIAAAWRNGIPAEDLRHELITAANHVRNSINKGDH